jgi:YfiH family protein
LSPPRWTAANLAGIAHGFFGRKGGVSSGIYASLNAGAGSKDAPAAVSENRRRIASAFDLPPERLVGVHQVHSPIAVHVDAPWPNERPHADALVTTTPGLALAIVTADCAPVLLADAEAGVIAAAHAGWRGAIGGVIEAAIRTMVEAGAKTERIVAAIGPCIQQASYEVGPDLAAQCAEWERDQFFKPALGDRLMFDLPGLCVARLQRAGVKEVEDLRIDTYADSASLFSCRRSSHEKLEDYGRNCAIIALSQN